MTVRPAQPTDLPLVAPIEDAGDRMFADRFGGVDWPAAASGEERAAEPGILLVVGDPVAGFAHVLDLDGHWHLEQLAVRPERQGAGLGTALLDGVHAEVAARGGAEVTLRTYADVPWNAPWYARRGYVEVETPAWLAPSLEGEDRVRLADHGRRVTMVRRLPIEHRAG